jgi:hypothetical protein
MTDDCEAAATASSERKLPPVCELVGRDQELAEFDTVLERRQPGLVIVAGDPGMGKTSFLRIIEADAVKRGWKTVRGDDQGELSIEPFTTEAIFCSRVRELLKIPVNESFAETTPDFDVMQPPFHSLVEQLRRRAPVLVLIDGYRPEAGFASWFTNRFHKDVKQAAAPVVIVVADRPNDVSMLDAFADESISLGPLDRQSIRHLLDTIGQRMTPPMTVAELDEYVKQVCNQPEILGSLKSVLDLA